MQAGVVLLLLAPSGLWMAYYAQTGTVAGIGFALLAIATGTCVLLGLAIRGEAAICGASPVDDAMLSAVMLGSDRQGHRWTGHGGGDRGFLDLSDYRLGELAGSAGCFRVDWSDSAAAPTSRYSRQTSAFLVPAALSLAAMEALHHDNFRSHLRFLFINFEAPETLAHQRKSEASDYACRSPGCYWDHRRYARVVFSFGRTAREAARRNTCICNLKQLSLALQNYHDTRKSFPMASTSPLVPANGIQKYGAVGSGSPSAESPTNWTAGQQGDGYSWIVQCLPFMEENSLYEKMTAVQDKPVARYGKFADAAFAPSSNLKLEATATNASPFFWSTKISTFVCPSFPGEDEVDSFGDIPKSKVAMGNYVALAATHYRSSPSNHLESLFPVGEAPNAGGHDCTNVTYCGNGGLPFPASGMGRFRKWVYAFKTFAVARRRWQSLPRVAKRR